MNDIFDVTNLYSMGGGQTINKKSSGLQSIEIFQKEGSHLIQRTYGDRVLPVEWLVEVSLR